jgi:hypothetical protein
MTETRSLRNMSPERRAGSPLSGDSSRRCCLRASPGAALTLLRTIHGKDESGDGTVPRGLRDAHSSREDPPPGCMRSRCMGRCRTTRPCLIRSWPSSRGSKSTTAPTGRARSKSASIWRTHTRQRQPILLRASTTERVATLNADLYDARVPAGRDAPRLKQVVLRDNGQGELTAETALSEGAYRVTVGGAANVASATDCFLVVAEGG